ncbi:MAG: PH domain-containing protein [Planctomycetes bacterium]|nr:PH domain-containing protein [Planctomycetota bacterium]
MKPPPVEGGQEVDVWWGSYAGRTLWPSFVVCGWLTLGIGWAAWRWWSLYPDRPFLVRYSAYGLAAIVWGVQLLRWAYGTVSINYRLTTRRLLRDRGFRHPAAGCIELERITAVEVRHGFGERLVNVGALWIWSEDGSSGPLVLEGVLRPKAVAALIRSRVRRARARHPGHPIPDNACPPQLGEK